MGEWNKLIIPIVGITVSIICLATILMPVIGDATKTTEVVSNKGTYKMTDNDDNYTFTYDPINQAFVINGQSYPWANIPEGRYTLISVNTFMFRFQNFASENYALYRVSDDAASVIASSLDTSAKTYTFNDGVYTGSDGTTTYNYTSSSFRAISSDGGYIMTNGIDKPIINATSSIIIGHGTTTITSWTDTFYITGTINDGVTVVTKDTITVSDVRINAIESSQYVGGYVLDSITFTATSGSTSVDATYNRIIVPATITFELKTAFDDGPISILLAIPVMVILVILMAAASMIMRNRE